MKEQVEASWAWGASKAKFWKKELWKAQIWKAMVLRKGILWRDTAAQDLVEYALLAGFVAVAAGALLPGVSASISTIFSKMGSVLSAAAT